MNPRTESISSVTLNTQVLFSARFEVVSEVRAHGLVTTHAGHNLPCALIKGFLSNRMAELAVGLVASDATIGSSVL